MGKRNHIHFGINLQKNTSNRYFQSIMATRFFFSIALAMSNATIGASISIGYFFSPANKGVATNPGQISVKRMFNFCIRANWSRASR